MLGQSIQAVLHLTRTPLVFGLLIGESHKGRVDLLKSSLVLRQPAFVAFYRLLSFVHSIAFYTASRSSGLTWHSFTEPYQDGNPLSSQTTVTFTSCWPVAPSGKISRGS